MIFPERITNNDELDAVVAEKLAVVHALEASICKLSRHPQATNELLVWLCEIYGDLEALSKIKFPPKTATD